MDCADLIDIFVFKFEKFVDNVELQIMNQYIRIEL
jgi:hypothetical protein